MQVSKLVGRFSRDSCKQANVDLVCCALRCAVLCRALLLQDDEFDWEGDRPLETPMEDLVIYEMHVRGENSCR